MKLIMKNQCNKFWILKCTQIPSIFCHYILPIRTNHTKLKYKHKTIFKWIEKYRTCYRKQSSRHIVSLVHESLASPQVHDLQPPQVDPHQAPDNHSDRAHNRSLHLFLSWLHRQEDSRSIKKYHSTELWKIHWLGTSSWYPWNQNYFKWKFTSWT